MENIKYQAYYFDGSEAGEEDSLTMLKNKIVSRTIESKYAQSGPYKITRLVEYNVDTGEEIDLPTDEFNKQLYSEWYLAKIHSGDELYAMVRDA